MRAIRAPYLSTTPPPRRNQKHAHTSSTQTPLGEVPSYLTDPLREQIDAQTSALLRDLNSNITTLAQANNIRHQTAQQRLEKKYGKSTNFLLRWAAGGDDADVGDAGKTEQRIAEEGTEQTLHMFREGVLWYLNWGLKNAVQTQQEMVEKRLEREREKKASTLYDARNRNVKLQSTIEDDDAQGLADSTFDMRGRDAYNPALDTNSEFIGGQQLSTEQMQLFQEENNSLMNHYNETLTQVTQAEKSLVEISSLQQTLVGHLNVQGEMIGSLVADAERTDENVTRGNKELKRATERTSTAKYMYRVTCTLCAVLVVWDLIF